MSRMDLFNTVMDGLFDPGREFATDPQFSLGYVVKESSGRDWPIAIDEHSAEGGQTGFESSAERPKRRWVTLPVRCAQRSIDPPTDETVLQEAQDLVLDTDPVNYANQWN